MPGPGQQFGRIGHDVNPVEMKSPLGRPQKALATWPRRSDACRCREQLGYCQRSANNGCGQLALAMDTKAG